MGNKRKLQAAACTAATLFIFLMILGGTAWAGDINITAPTVNTVFSETREYSTVVFGDPWDLCQWTDMSYSQYYNAISGFKVGPVNGRGVVRGHTTGPDAYFHPLFPGYLDAVPMGRDGAINRIDTSKFNSISFRMYSSERTSGQIYWFFNQVWNNYGVENFTVYEGWHTYKINLDANSKWTGKPMGLRFDPAGAAGIDFKIDWMRLYKRHPRRVKLKWTDANPGSTVSIYIDDDMLFGKMVSERLSTRVSNAENTFTWDPSAYPPGKYFFGIRKGGTTVWSARTQINKIPLVQIINPDERGGKDYATAELHNPWNMNSASDVTEMTRLKEVKFKNGIMSGKNVNRDGYFYLNTKKINPYRYHRLTFRFRYDGQFGFGAGTMSRVIWSPNQTDWPKYSTSDDIVTYPRWLRYTIDLKKMPLDAGKIGWNGPIRAFRFDPLELAQPRRFYVDYIRLSDDDRANKEYAIQWKESKWAPRPTKVALYYDKNKKDFNGKFIAGKLKSVRGMNKYVWNTRNVPEGKYWIHITANDGVSCIKRYSSGPIVIDH